MFFTNLQLPTQLTEQNLTVYCFLQLASEASVYLDEWIKEWVQMSMNDYDCVTTSVSDVRNVFHFVISIFYFNLYLTIRSTMLII